MLLTSPAFINNENIPEQYTCKGKGHNPPLQISGVPSDAVSLALIVDDPDAPGGTWTHWLVWNIDKSVTMIGPKSVPKNAVQGKNGSGEVGWYPPCPPTGVHRYYFKLYALNGALSLKEGSTQDQLQEAMADKVLATAELIGLFRK